MKSCNCSHLPDISGDDCGSDSSIEMSVNYFDVMREIARTNANACIRVDTGKNIGPYASKPYLQYSVKAKPEIK